MARRKEPNHQERFGARVQTLRRERGFSQSELADLCGISQKYLSELERGIKAPSFATMLALAHRGFEIRIDVLLYSIDERPSAEVGRLEGLLAGRSTSSQQRILQALALLLDAASAS